MFDIDFRYIVTILLPTRLRLPKTIAWLRVIVSYLKVIYTEFKIYRSKKLYEINFTGQVIYLEKKLQDTFNCPDIYISDGLLTLPLFLTNKEEGRSPVYFGNLFILGVIYQINEEIVYENKWYSYTATGNGTVPTSDPSAVAGDNIETFAYNVEEGSTNSNFIVNIPSDCYTSLTTDDFNKIHSIVQFVILADKTYNLKEV